ncbi:MAG: ammonium transporter, partial [Pseudomonadota bacterium]
MKTVNSKLLWAGGIATLYALSAGPALAQDANAAPGASTQFILNTLLFLMGGFLVMWMAAGFAMLEAGMVRSKNVAMQCTKNIALYSIAGIMFYLVGYKLMYPGDGAWMVQDYVGAIAAYPTQPAGAGIDQGTYSVASDWFFQMVFCATTASIVSGTIAERTKLWPFLIFVVVLTGFIYPIQGSWEWGTG